MFSSQYKARIMQTRYQLTTLKKGALYVTDYFQKAQNLAHTLDAIDEPLKESEIVSYILAGLSTDYDPLATSVTTRIDPISMEDLYGHLLTHEQRIELHNSAHILSQSGVNVAQRNQSSSNKNSQSQFSSGLHNAGRRRGCGSPEQGNFSNYNSTNRLVCQVCHKVGHSTTYDHSYQGETTAHAAHNAPATYFTSLHMATDPNWYHHLINELSNLNMRADEYTDNDQIRVGNKQGPQFRDVTAPRAK